MGKRNEVRKVLCYAEEAAEEAGHWHNEGLSEDSSTDKPYAGKLTATRRRRVIAYDGQIGNGEEGQEGGDSNGVANALGSG